MLLVGCSGCSSSGKTTIVKIFNTIIQEKDKEYNTNFSENLVVLHEDDFFKTDADIPIDPIKNISYCSDSSSRILVGNCASSKTFGFSLIKSDMLYVSFFFL